jgi:hypothetical protein
MQPHTMDHAQNKTYQFLFPIPTLLVQIVMQYDFTIGLVENLTPRINNNNNNQAF